MGGNSLAVTYDVTFHGVASHAGGSPHLVGGSGRRRTHYVGVNTWREQVIEKKPESIT
jgi:hypothetical protein